jgi:hypothetical protein
MTQNLNYDLDDQIIFKTMEVNGYSIESNDDKYSDSPFSKTIAIFYIRIYNIFTNYFRIYLKNRRFDIL